MMFTTRILALVLATSQAVYAINLGTADVFGALAGTTVTNAGLTVVTGDIGVYPGTAVTGFPPGTIIGGSTHLADATSKKAQQDALIAYTALVAASPATTLSGDLGGKTLKAGVYKFATTATLSGKLTLDGQGSTTGVWIFQVGTALSSTAASSVVLKNGAAAANVFWKVGSSATIGGSFAGNVVAYTTITLLTGTSSNGGLYALNGAVNLSKNTVSAPA